MDYETSNFYSNEVQLASSPWDITIDFKRVGFESVLSEGENMPVKPKVIGSHQVTMSPSHAKIFAALLIEQIDSYEKKFGKIPLEEASQKKFDKILKSATNILSVVK